MQRIIFTLKMLWRYRKQLYDYLSKLSLQTETILSLSPQKLKAAGIEGIVLDYDGVLAGYAVETPYSPQANWLKQALEVFGAGHVYILSNRPSPQRIQYFLEHFPEIQFVQARKKPYPDGLLQIAQRSNLLPKQLLILDDRLLTGILTAIITGTKALWITKPEINFQHRPIQECGFVFLRWLDKTLIQWLHYF